MMPSAMIDTLIEEEKKIWYPAAPFQTVVFLIEGFLFLLGGWGYIIFGT